MNLIIDIGNNCTKMAIFDGKKKEASFRIIQFTSEIMQKFCEPYAKKLDKAIISSVSNIPLFVIDLLTHEIPYVHILSHKSILPFKNEYETPETLGSDRIAAVAGAYYHFREKRYLLLTLAVQ